MSTDVARVRASTPSAQPAKRALEREGIDSDAIKWNLPAAYPADNPHSENLVAFAKDVDTATSSKLQITVPIQSRTTLTAPKISGRSIRLSGLRL